MATAQDNLMAEIDGRIERRLTEEAEAHEAELEEMDRGERMIRYSDLDGEYRRLEGFYDWSEDDKRARQLAAVSEWPISEVRRFREELEEIEGDDRYAEEHKEQLKAELAREWLNQDSGAAERGGRLLAADSHVNRIRKRAQLRAEEFTPFDPPEAETAAYSAQREREIREALAAEEDAGKRLERAQQLVDSGDPEAMRAVLNPPPGTAPLTEPNVRMLRKRALRNRYGDDALEELQALDGMADLAQHNVNEARNEIARLGGLQ